MSEPFEYAIKKDVRNNPIVREVDESRQRELWKSVAVAGLFVAAALFAALQHFELLRHGYRLEQMQRDNAAAEEDTRRLLVDIAELKAPRRIEQLALKTLRLVAPTREDAIILERVTPIAPPDSSVVARR